MQQSNFRERSRDLPNSLNFDQEQVVFVLGHSLRGLYDDVFQADLPEHLKSLVRRLEKTCPP
jgi:hypothetical protein